MKSKISKKLSIITATVLFSTLLIPVNSAPAFSAEVIETPTETTTAPVLYPTINSVSITKETAETVTIKAVLSESLETNGNTLYLYKNGQSAIENESTTGSTIEFVVDRPEQGSQGYYVSVGDKISQVVSVDSIQNNSWNLALTSDKYSFSTNASTDTSNPEKLPKLSWSISNSKSLTSPTLKRVYLVDSNQNVIANFSHLDIRTISIPKFFEDETKYKVYVANGFNYSARKKLSDLTEIVAVSNEITIIRDSYNAQLSIDLENYTAANPKLTFTSTLNQGTGGGYALHIVDETSDKIVSTTGSSGVSKPTITAIYDGKKREYRAYVAKNPTAGTTKSALESIEAVSNLVTSDHEDWVISATTDNPSFYTDETTPRIFFTLNQKSDLSDYRVSFVDIVTNKTFYTTWVKDLQSSQTIDRFYFEKEKQFKMVVSKSSCFGGCRTPVSQLTDVQAESNIVTIKRAPWNISLTTPHVNGQPAGENVSLIWNTNQSASWIHTGPVNYNENYTVYAYKHGKDGLTNSSIQTYTDYVYTGGISFSPPDEKETLKYTLYVARKSSGTVNSPADLVDVQAVSNTLIVPPKKWELKISDIVEEPRYSSAKVYLDINQSIYLSKYYDVHIIDSSTGKIVSSGDVIYSSGKIYKTISIATKNPNTRYVAYVAEKKTTQIYGSDFTDVKATSNDFFASDAVTSNSFDYSRSARFQSGANPSTADCKQVCHGDPVNTFNGELFENSTDLNLEGNLSISFTRSYSTFRRDKLGSLGYGWSSNYDLKLKGDNSSLQESKYITVVQENGSEVVFSKITDGGVDSYIASGTVKASLKFDQALGKIVFERTNGTKMIFTDSGVIESISDKFNQKIELIHNEDGTLKAVKNGTNELNLEWSNSLISSVTDGVNTVNYVYENGSLVKVDSSFVEADKEYTYLEDHKIKKIIHPNGGVYESFYDNESRVIQQINPLGDSTDFSYSSTSLPSVTTITLPNGEKTVEKYDTNGRLYERVLGSGTAEAATYRYSYYASGELISETNPKGAGVNYRYDLAGNIIMATDPLARVTRFVYNEKNQLVETINALGQRTSNVYDGKGLLVKTVYPDGGEKIYENDDQNRMVSSRNPKQQADNIKSLYSYGSNGLVNSVTDTLGGASRIEYDAARNVKKSINSLNVETSFEYLNNNLLSKVTYGDSSSETYEYDSAGRITKKTNKNGNSTSYTYDKMDNIVSITNDYGTTTFKFDKNQKLESTTDPKGATTSYIYNALGLVKEVNQPGDRKSSLTYTTQGLLQSKTDYLGNTTTYAYDAVGNVIYVTDPTGKSTSFAYNKLNQVIQETSPLGKAIGYTYNSMGLVSQKFESNLRTTSYSYDLNQNLTKTTYNDGSKETRTYDSENQLVSLTDRNGKTESYVYDSEGQTIKKVRSDGTEIDYSYDSNGNILTVEYDDGTLVENVYDLAGKLVSMKKTGSETVNYTYDSIGNVTSRGPPNKEVNYTYSSNGEITSVVYPSGRTVDYSYDIFGHISEVSTNEETLVSYNYDKNNNLTSSTYGNNTTKNNVYDKLNRLTSIEVLNSGSQIYKRNLTFDADSYISAAQSIISETATEDKTYSYTKLGTISSVTDKLNPLVPKTDAYTYDFLNNLTKLGNSTHTYPTTDTKLTSSLINGVSHSYTYDNLGNRTSSTVGGEVLSYEWTADNKLSKVAKAEDTFNYKYDPQGLLTSKTTNEENSEEFVWDTVSSSIPVLLNDSKFEYIYGVDSTPFAQVDKASGNITYLYGDERNSVIAAADEVGAKLWSRNYSEYGALLSQTGDSSQDVAFGYAGEFLDSDTNLYNLRARWYEPSTASFINVDPAVRLTGESYSYASGNPLSNTDPLGLMSQSDLGNAVAGGLDGLIGIPLASGLMNSISPGSVDNCSALYAGIAGVATVGSLFIPGFGQAKGALLAGKAFTKGFSKFSSVVARANADQRGGVELGLLFGQAGKKEVVWRNGKTREEIDTSMLPRFNSQQAHFGEAAKHNADILQGRVFLLTKESKGQIPINRKDNLKGIPTQKGHDRDEVPPASTTAARDAGSSVRHIDPTGNRRHGSALRWFYEKNGIKEGDEFIYE